MTLSTKFVIPALLSTTLLTTGCDLSPDQGITDTFAQKLLLRTENDQDLVDHYHIMTDATGKEIGAIFTESVAYNRDKSEISMTYRSYTAGKDKPYPANESAARTTPVIPNI